LLCVGRLNVRKNLAFSIEAALRSGVLSADRPLVVVGEAHGRAAELSPAGREAVERGLVVLLGAVDDAELAWLYGHALLFLFMTRDEGFGLPPVEARYFGCPVLASDIPVLRETVGDHARFADPTDLHAVASAVTDAIETPWPNEHVAAATWSECAGRMRAAVLEQRRRRCAGRSSVLALTRNSRR
jgi:glycosyltransferase involved in cell wall biosynthesis